MEEMTEAKIKVLDGRRKEQNERIKLRSKRVTQSISRRGEAPLFLTYSESMTPACANTQPVKRRKKNCYRRRKRREGSGGVKDKGNRYERG